MENVISWLDLFETWHIHFVLKIMKYILVNFQKFNFYSVKNREGVKMG